MARSNIKIPNDVRDYLPGGQHYDHSYDPFCDGVGCNCVKERAQVMICASGGGSGWSAIAGCIAHILSNPQEVTVNDITYDARPPRCVNITGCSAGSINAVAYAAGLFTGVPGKEFLSAINDELNVPTSFWPWIKKKQLKQRAWLRDTWLPRYWELCKVPWSSKTRIRDIVAQVCVLVHPGSKALSPFAPPWSDPGTLMMVLKSIFCGGVNDNSECFSKTASIFPEKFDKNSSPTWRCTAAALATDVWNQMPIQFVSWRNDQAFDQLGPYWREVVNEDGTIQTIAEQGKHPPIAAITYHDKDITVLKVIAASCSIPGLMKAEKLRCDPKNYAVYWSGAYDEAGWDEPPEPFNTELYDGGLYLTVPYGLLEPWFEIPDQTTSCTPYFIMSPYLTQTVYSRTGRYQWKNRYFTGPWEEKPSWWKRHIVARLMGVFQTMYDTSSLDTIYDQYTDMARGAKGRLTATEHAHAKTYLIEDKNLPVLKDLPGSRTMSDGWEKEGMIYASVLLGYHSAAWEAEDYPDGWSADGRI